MPSGCVYHENGFRGASWIYHVFLPEGSFCRTGQEESQRSHDFTSLIHLCYVAVSTNWGFLLVGVLLKRVLPFGGCTRAPGVWKLPCMNPIAPQGPLLQFSVQILGLCHGEATLFNRCFSGPTCLQAPTPSIDEFARPLLQRKLPAVGSGSRFTVHSQRRQRCQLRVLFLHRSVLCRLSVSLEFCNSCLDSR